MNTRIMFRRSLGGPPAPSGMTLLEVLVACGVLMFALAGIAAILPAASSLLVTATAEDRAISAAANAYSELMARGIVASASFPALTGTSAPWFGGAMVLGGPLEAALEAALAGGGRGSEMIPSLFQSFNDKNTWPVPGLRGPFSEDDVRFSTESSTVPQSSYAATVTDRDGRPAPYGPREVRTGPAWSAMILSSAFVTEPGARPAAGAAALLSIASFRNVSDQPDAGIVIRMQERNEFFLIEGATRSQLSAYLKPGSWLLLLPPPPLPTPPSTPRPPRWIRVNSAWWTPAGIFVTFGESIDQLSSHMAGQELFAVGFKNLIAVQIHTVTLR